MKQVILIIALCLPALASAGEPERGTPVRWRTVGAGDSWQEGNYVGRELGNLLLAQDDEVLRVPHVNVVGWREYDGRRRHTGTGAAVGAFLVGAGGLALGMAFANDSFFDVDGGEVFAITMVSAGAGAAIGALVGTGFSSPRYVDAAVPGQELGRAPPFGAAVTLRF